MHHRDGPKHYKQHLFIVRVTPFCTTTTHANHNNTLFQPTATNCRCICCYLGRKLHPLFFVENGNNLLMFVLFTCTVILAPHKGQCEYLPNKPQSCLAAFHRSQGLKQFTASILKGQASCVLCCVRDQKVLQNRP